MIDGADELKRKLNELAAVNAAGAVAMGIEKVKAGAKLRCPVNDGELRQSIMSDVYLERDRAIGECYTNKSYAGYVEFGTGPRGQESHEGIAPDVAVSYTQSPWWIHEGPGENEVDRETGEQYGWFYIETDEGRFYQCTGQPAQPFMYPALADSQKEVLKGMKTAFAAEVKKKS